MMRGRRPNIRRVVHRVQGRADAKARLQALLASLAGMQTVAQACAALGVGERRYYKLRDSFLQAALAWCEPRGPGRPVQLPKSNSASDRRIAELESVLRDLRIDLQAARIREEMALAMPNVMRRAGRFKKGVTRRRRRPANGAAIQPSDPSGNENAECAGW